MYGDAQMHLDSARFNKPGTIPLEFQVEARLLALRIVCGNEPAPAGIDWDAALRMTALAKAAAADGVAGYAVLIVEKPNS